MSVVGAIPQDEPTDPQTPSAKLRASMPPTPEPPAEVIDVSAFQAPSSIVWPRVRASGVSGVYAKATEGVGSPDGTFLRHVEGARSAGLLVGAYHYLHVRQAVQDTAAQAQQFAARYAAAACELRPAIDVEPDDNPRGVAPAVWLQAVLDLANAVTQACGVRPLIYSFPAFWRSLQPETRPELEMYGLWVATYGGVPAAMPPWGTDYVLWQYSGGEIVDGCAGKVDRSRTRSGMSGLLRAA